MTAPVVALVLEALTLEPRLPLLFWVLPRVPVVGPCWVKLLLALLASALELVVPALLMVGDELVETLLLEPLLAEVFAVTEQLYCLSI